MTALPLSHDLIAAFQQGSYTAIDTLFHSCYASLAQMATQLTGSEAEGHHITLEAFIKLLMMREQFDNEADIKAFLYITVRNICLTCMKAGPAAAITTEAPWYNNIAATANRYNSDNQRAKGIQQLLEEVAQLPEEYRRVLQAIYYDRSSIPVIAAQLQRSQVYTAKKRIQALRLLREQLYLKDRFAAPLFIYFLTVAARR
jgi:RNA polymerase sigma factor (sigma-70 family)